MQVEGCPNSIHNQPGLLLQQLDFIDIGCTELVLCSPQPSHQVSQAIAKKVGLCSSATKQMLSSGVGLDFGQGKWVFTPLQDPPPFFPKVIIGQAASLLGAT